MITFENQTDYNANHNIEKCIQLNVVTVDYNIVAMVTIVENGLQ